MSDQTEAVVTDAAQDVQAVVADLPLLVQESKAGYKTTEFWITVVTSLLVVLNGIPLPDKYEGVVVAALAAVYALSRGVAKKGVPAVVPTVPEA